TSSRIDEDRRRQIAIHEKSATTKIIEIPPEERITDNPRRGGGNQSTRNGIGSNLLINNGP
ncbi:unnamed protein product, partial [Rotaria magnacalcarata]